MSTSGAELSVRLYIFSGARKSNWALLKCFGRLRMELTRSNDLRFVRAMGCGQGIGFSMLPDLSRYAVMAVADDAQLDAFEAGRAMTGLAGAAKSLDIYDLLPLRGHGLWDGVAPFEAAEDPLPGAPIAVLTRARVPLRAIPEFIRQSNKVTAALAAAPGRIFSLGMGELPLIRQATFSVWADSAAMEAFAYGNEKHRTAVAATRKKRLFGEELFWRFAIRGYTKRPLG